MSGRSVTLDGEYAVIRIPMNEVHGLRVALAPCPCKGPKAEGTSSIRDNLSRALARLQEQWGGKHGKWGR